MRLTLTTRTPASDTTTHGRQKVAHPASANNAIHGIASAASVQLSKNPIAQRRAGQKTAMTAASTRPARELISSGTRAILPDERTPR